MCMRSLVSNLYRYIQLIYSRKNPSKDTGVEIPLSAASINSTYTLRVVRVENRMMITQIKNDLDRQVEELVRQIEKLEVRND
jgi:hypothetical protein